MSGNATCGFLGDGFSQTRTKGYVVLLFIQNISQILMIGLKPKPRHVCGGGRRWEYSTKSYTGIPTLLLAICKLFTFSSIQNYAYLLAALNALSF